MDKVEHYKGFIIRGQAFQKKDATGWRAQASVTQPIASGEIDTPFTLTEDFSTGETAIEAALR